MTDLPYRKNVSILLYNQYNQLLLGERARQPGIWQFPQGGVEGQDTLEDTVYKEIHEELGLEKSSVKITKKLQTTNCYKWEIVPEHWSGKFQGQDQTFWLVELINPNPVFNLELHKPEFGQVKWFDIDSVLDIVEKVRLKGYTSAVEEVKNFLKDAASK